MTVCRVCEAPLDDPIYRSQGHASMTTMLRHYDDPTVVRFCDRCGHLQTDEIIAPREYYAHQYSILAASDEEDMLYKVVDGRQVYQVEHRVETLLNKVAIPAEANVLDFGCAKGAVLKRLVQSRPDITPHFFDVTDRYVSFWQRVGTRKSRDRHGSRHTPRDALHHAERDDYDDGCITSERWAVGTMPDLWSGRLDLVCSFYVLEHVADPVATVREMASLLKPGGTIYLLVPNALANPADVIVADHLQHYSENSLSELLRRAGLDVVDIDDTSHDAAYIAIGRQRASRESNAPTPNARPVRVSVSELRRHYTRTADAWSDSRQRIQAFEMAANHGRPACIYGAGFYGNFIASCLSHPENIACFVDQNSFLHGRTVLDKPIVDPANLDDCVEVMYVGLNPALARTVIAEIPAWRNRQFETFYL